MLQAATPTRRAGFIAGPVADSVFLIAAPLVAVLVYLPFALHPVFQHPYPDGHFGRSVADGFITAVIFGHLFAVFFRSHLNRSIFRLHPLRFTLIPVLLFAALCTSMWVLVVVTVLAVWWDVYHSSMQTFGIGRIYDVRAGNDPNAGRRLDMIWNVLMYAGPILAGASLLSHLERFEDFAQVEVALLVRVPVLASEHARWLTAGVLAFGVPFSIYYVFRYWQMARSGYRVSLQKVFLYVILGLVSILCWGFNSFGEAYFVMNFFHALQYFFIVWHTEGRNVTSRLGLAGSPQGRYLALALFLLIGTGFGLWATDVLPASQPPKRIYVSALLVVSILHFWYDGFIWSVRRGEVR